MSTGFSGCLPYYLIMYSVYGEINMISMMIQAFIIVCSAAKADTHSRTVSGILPQTNNRRAAAAAATGLSVPSAVAQHQRWRHVQSS